MAKKGKKKASPMADADLTAMSESDLQAQADLLELE